MIAQVHLRLLMRMELSALMTMILAATDLSARSDRAIERALERGQALSLPVIAAHVVDSALPESLKPKLQEAAETQIRSCLSAIAGAQTPEIRILDGQAMVALLSVAEGEDAAMIVTGIHRNFSAGRPMVGSTIERLVRVGRRPVLVVRDPVNGPYRRVVVAMDFSPSARAAFRAACRLAPEAEIIAVHAYHAPFGGFYAGDEVRETVEREHAAEFAAMLEDEVERLLRRGQSQPKVTSVQRHGEAAQVLREVQQAKAGDLVVIGAHGRTGLMRMMLGSVAEGFLAHPPCDVLAVHAG